MVTVANVDVRLAEPAGQSVADPSVSSPPIVLRARPSRYSLYAKRPLDIALSLAGLLVLSPLMLLLALLVRVNLGRGGVIYRQQRVGRNGQAFEIFKFRSMLPDRRGEDRAYIGPERRKTHKSANDPRHTPFGRFLRSSSLDELPQLVNVLRGDMSLIGPRPELVSVAAREGFLVHPRHLERPGITGRFQVSELRAMNRISAGLHLDVAYVADVRLRSDLAILFKTLFVLFGRGS
jgi:lipopolysaccharide/colanic/teichoic acid biosynthesis glycosyltransferase